MLYLHSIFDLENENKPKKKSVIWKRSWKTNWIYCEMIKLYMYINNKEKIYSNQNSKYKKN